MDSSDSAKRLFFDCLSPRCGAALATAFAEILADGLDALQMDTLGSFLTLVGDNLSYMAVQKELNEAKCQKKKNTDDSDSNTQSDNTESDNTESDNTEGKHTNKSKGGARREQGGNGEAVVYKY